MADLLTQYLMASTAAEFKYGIADCATFCLGWADALTGRNGVAEWQGRYRDEASCKAFIEDGCGMTSIAADFLRDTYGVGLAKGEAIGNIVLASVGPSNVTAFGIRCADDAIIFRLERGLFATRRAAALHEWGPLCPQ